MDTLTIAAPHHAEAVVFDLVLANAAYCLKRVGLEA
jgi:hypothetical protein